MSKRKIRADFRKNRTPRQRDSDLTRRFERDDADQLDEPRQERISGKGELTRRRTVIGTAVEEDAAGFAVQPEIDLAALPPRPRAERARSVVHSRSRRRHLFPLHHAADSANALDRSAARGGRRRSRVVSSWPIRSRRAYRDQAAQAVREGFIERIEPRRTVLSRTVRGKQHVIVTNVDQMVIVSSAAEPRLKPGLIDRYLVSAEKESCGR